MRVPFPGLYRRVAYARTVNLVNSPSGIFPAAHGFACRTLGAWVDIFCPIGEVPLRVERGAFGGTPY
jgi:hypothetical protein